MRKKQMMHVSKVTSIALDTVEMVLKNKEVSQTAVPGQFLHIAVPGHTLRRPVSIADVNRDDDTITILFKTIGTGTKELASVKQGSELDVLGPNGNGFPVDTIKPSTVLLIGGGIGVPPLYYLAKSLAEKGCHVISVLGFQTKDYVFYEDQFKAIGKTYIVTDDGSYGHKGLVTDVLSDIGSFETYFSCGPLPMLKAVRHHLKDTPGYLSLEERMGCGIGACYACVIPTNDEVGYKKICQHGPVFKSEEVQL
ncbi:MAG TPA: dihydroorotate dehydrogenase electron transfer subunit [Cerasibacillus sp.]|uniref:dihydroorotate dehydrogenase electron transfer subunit n=1 Tax=Cerasibacillus sp. TaxID=2498711 RepID=UPI002F416AF7